MGPQEIQSEHHCSPSKWFGQNASNHRSVASPRRKASKNGSNVHLSHNNFSMSVKPTNVGFIHFHNLTIAVTHFFFLSFLIRCLRNAWSFVNYCSALWIRYKINQVERATSALQLQRVELAKGLSHINRKKITLKKMDPNLMIAGEKMFLSLRYNIVLQEPRK